MLQALTIAALALSASLPLPAKEIQNWLSSDGTPWRNASVQCWRSGFWTPETAAPGCDGAAPAAGGCTGASAQSRGAGTPASGTSGRCTRCGTGTGGQSRARAAGPCAPATCAH